MSNELDDATDDTVIAAAAAAAARTPSASRPGPRRSRRSSSTPTPTAASRAPPTYSYSSTTTATRPTIAIGAARGRPRRAAASAAGKAARASEGGEAPKRGAPSAPMERRRVAPRGGAETSGRVPDAEVAARVNEAEAARRLEAGHRAALAIAECARGRRGAAAAAAAAADEGGGHETVRVFGVEDDDASQGEAPLAHFNRRAEATAYDGNLSRLRRAGWPAFPLPAALPRQGRTLPARVAVRARIVDFGGCEVADELRRYLVHIGCEVGLVDRSASQYAYTCGIVAARVVNDLWAAADWRTAAVGRAVDDQWPTAVNVSCGLFTARQVEGKQPLQRGAIRSRARPPSRFLFGWEVDRCVEHFFREEWPADVRARGNAAGVAVGSWYDGAVARDEVLARLSRLVGVVEQGVGGCASLWRAHVVSDDDSHGRGSHWMAIAFEVVRVDGAEAMHVGA